MRPVALPSYIRQLWSHDKSELTALIKKNYSNLQKGPALISVVIPAYNEEENILTTLLSISQNITRFSAEIIVVNNKSTDRTEELVRAAGVTCLNESQHAGPRYAREKGLRTSTAKYIINADADSIYPPTWIETLISPMEANEGLCNSYSRFAFLPSKMNSRFSLFLYENLADILRWYRRNFKEEAMYVYGCSSAFKREQGLAVNGYDHPPGANEDGFLALKLREKGFGKLNYVSSNKALVWTVDRHLQKDGGLWKAMLMRIARVFGKGKPSEMRTSEGGE